MSAERPYTLGSLFAGIGGIDLAFEAAGFETKWQVEIEDFPRQVLERHWPGLLRPRDVRGCTGRSGKGWRRYQQLPHVDVMAGGFPCQDISVAGKGVGIRVGTRSGLWFEFARLISELRPRIVFLENVSAITTRDGTAVIGTLAELGYDARFGLIRASDAGAPHQRERWFCVAFPEKPQRAAERLGSRQAAMGDVLDHRPEQRRSVVAHAERTKRRPNGAGQRELDRTDHRLQTGWLEGSSGLAERGQELAYASGARLEVGTGVRGYAGEEQPPTKRGGAEVRAWIPVGHRGEWGNRAAQPGLGRGADGLSAWLDASYARWPAGPGRPQHAWEPPRVTSWQPDRTKRLKALGNAVVPQVVYPLAVAIREWLQAQDEDAGADVERATGRAPAAGRRAMSGRLNRTDAAKGAANSAKL